MRTQPRVVVIGSGAGGAVTALELVSRGLDVTMIEEGRRTTLDDYGGESPKAMQSLYRSRGMTPILGGIPIAYVEGCVVGGSTEINSGFWHRTPREVLINWQVELPRFCGHGQLTRRRSSHVHGSEGAEGEKRGGRARARLSVHGGVSTRSAEDGRRRKVCDGGKRGAWRVDGDAQTMAFEGRRHCGTRGRIRVFG
jgi:choline dehydrogenase-like flavoprotein